MRCWFRNISSGAGPQLIPPAPVSETRESSFPQTREKTQHVPLRILRRQSRKGNAYVSGIDQSGVRRPPKRRKPAESCGLGNGERGIRTLGPHFWSHIISNDAHSATLPSLLGNPAVSSGPNERTHDNRFAFGNKFSPFFAVCFSRRYNSNKWPFLTELPEEISLYSLSVAPAGAGLG